MQNLPNITLVESVVVGSAILVLWVAPAVLGWNDARRRRKVLAHAAAVEAALREAALREAAQRETALLVPPPVLAAAPSLVDVQQLWDEPTVTVDVDALGAPAAAPPPAAMFGTPVELPAPSPIEVAPVVGEAVPVIVETGPAIDEAVAAPRIADLAEPQQLPETTEPPSAAPASEPPAPADTPRFPFCLEELHRVRLPNWPPAEVQEDPARSEMWRDAERLAAERQREISALPLAAPHPVQSNCLGSAEADATVVRLHYLLFPVLWPSTEEQATAEAVFEIDRASGTIRTHVNSLRRVSV